MEGQNKQSVDCLLEIVVMGGTGHYTHTPTSNQWAGRVLTLFCPCSMPSVMAMTRTPRNSRSAAPSLSQRLRLSLLLVPVPAEA